MEKSVLAVDLGGTNLRLAAVGEDGNIIYRTKTDTPKSGGRKELVESIVRLAAIARDTASQSSEIVGIGLAVPAIINAAKGKIITSPNIAGINGFELSDAVAGRIGLPVVLENDATAAAIGENWLGASRDVSSSICVTLGTGVGGGIIINGEAVRGIDGTAGEVGHICVEPLGAECGCGSRGCVEQYASAMAIIRMTGELQESYPDSTLAGETDISPLAVFEAGMKGDALAVEVFRKAGSYLGIALGGLINVLNPEVVVIGGGVAAGWELFIGHVRSEIRKRAFQQPAERAKIIRAELADDAGILGAAKLAFRQH